MEDIGEYLGAAFLRPKTHIKELTKASARWNSSWAEAKDRSRFQIVCQGSSA